MFFKDCDIEMAKRFGVFNDTALKLAQHFWAGALTLVVPMQKNCGLRWHLYCKQLLFSLLDFPQR